MILKAPLVLASASERRQQLLRNMGIRFETCPSYVTEQIDPDMPPEDMVRVLALRKARHVADQRPDALTLGADTVVVLEGDILGKPDSPAEAERMLKRLSGATHSVYTGIALLHPPSNRTVHVSERTNVTFHTLRAAEITDYVASGSPLDKAGAYGIQDNRGPFFVRRIDGDYYNVVGLPLHRFYRILNDRFPDLLAEHYAA